MAKQLTETTGNPANGLRQVYDLLMQITCPQELAREAIGVVKPYVERGMKPPQFKKFQLTVTKTASEGLPKLQSYLTNFMLAADGLSVTAGARG